MSDRSSLVVGVASGLLIGSVITWLIYNPLISLQKQELIALQATATQQRKELDEVSYIVDHSLQDLSVQIKAVQDIHDKRKALLKRLGQMWSVKFLEDQEKFAKDISSVTAMGGDE